LFKLSFKYVHFIPVDMRSSLKYASLDIKQAIIDFRRYSSNRNKWTD